MKSEFLRDGNVTLTVTETLKLADFGKDAESSLPGYN